MSVIGLILLIAVIGLIVWFVTTVIPMPDVFRTAIIAVAILAVLLFILQSFGLISGLGLRLK